MRDLKQETKKKQESFLRKYTPKVKNTSDNPLLIKLLSPLMIPCKPFPLTLSDFIQVYPSPSVNRLILFL
jgi:hypothetical protein